MRSLLENKRLVVLLAALALGALTVLAISLNTIPFREAQLYAEPKLEAPAAPAAPAPPLQSGVPLWKQLLVMGLLILATILIGVLISPAFRKRLLKLLLRMIIWGVALYIVLALYPQILQLLAQFIKLPEQLMKASQLQSNDPSLAPMPLFEPPRPSSTLSYVISFAFVLLMLVALWGFYRGWQRYAALTSPQKPLDDIARIARSSLDDLLAGRESSDVIINCYLRMSDVVAQRRRLHRETAMTPHEFAQRLEQAGLPGEAVTQLTRLFEGVRYGDRKSAPKDVNEAVRCLQTILQYCGEPV